MQAYLLLALAAFVAGSMNAIAGGGTFITFPTLIFIGVPSIVANASNSVALFPASFASAWAYRSDFQKFDGVSLKAMLAVSIVGGALGAALLLYTPEQTFDDLVPWLLLAATLIFCFGPQITAQLTRMFRLSGGAVLAIQFAVAIYGGYFGGAMGIVMLAVYSLLGLTNLNAMNATKTLMAGVINAISVVLFIAAGKVVWGPTLVMMTTALLGGYFGARAARRMQPQHLRYGIMAISITVTAVFFVRQYHLFGV